MTGGTREVGGEKGSGEQSKEKGNRGKKNKTQNSSKIKSNGVIIKGFLKNRVHGVKNALSEP